MTRTKIVKVIDGRYIVAAHTNYQGFYYDTKKNICTPINDRMEKKWAAVEAVFPDLVRGRSFLDIGACMGFFCFKALEHGAKLAIGLEMNENFYRPTADALLELDVPELAWIKGKWPIEKSESFYQPIINDISIFSIPIDIMVDVVMAMSILQYIFPGLSLAEFLDGIARAATVAALVEFPCREDTTVIKEGWAPDHPEYSRASFEALARERFASVKYLGLGHTKTRHVYLLRK